MLYDIGIVRRRRIISGSDGYFSVPPPAAAPSTTTWSNTDHGPDLSVSPDFLTVSKSAGAAHNLIRSIASHGSGAYYCEFTINNLGGVAAVAVGIVNGAAPLTSPGTVGGSNAPGAGAGYGNSGAVEGSNGTFGGFTLATYSTYAATNIIRMFSNFTTNLLFFAVGSGDWNSNPSADPATGAGGLSFAAFAGLGPFFIGAQALDSPASITLNAGGSSYAFAVPSGGANW